MKRVYFAVILTCALVLLLFGRLNYSAYKEKSSGKLMVGFLYEDDESTPYTYNFTLAEMALREQYSDKVQIFSKSNVREKETEEPIRDLIVKGCSIIFTNSHSDNILAMASEYPSVQFCQISYLEKPAGNVPENYHTFKGEIYQGRFISGIVAGLKLRELIDNGSISPEEALVGYVGAFPSAAVMSGYTAFLLGVRSVAPEAVMKVRYTSTWGNFTLEKQCAETLINEGCIILSQHSDTIGPAVACEEAAARRQTYFIGYNQSMQNIAPTTALISTRINWIPYVCGAVEAVLQNKKIEKYVKGNVHGNDMSAGFELEWVQMLELNSLIAAEGTQEKMEASIAALKKGSFQVFQGDYLGVNPDNPDDTCDLNQGFKENKDSSSPAFHYVLQDVITVEE